MSTDVGIGICTEQQSIVEKQDSFTIEIINTVEDANNTNLDKEHSAAATELSKHFERISEIASKYKTVEMTNVMKKFNKTLKIYDAL